MMNRKISYARHLGPFIKPCPCSPQAVSCGYYNLNLHTGCLFSCSYCILQSYLPSKKAVFYGNLDDLEKELERFSTAKRFVRLGSGELSDSLVYENRLNYTGKLLKIFEKFPKVIFEFKTKSTRVSNLLRYPEVLKNIVVSWSLNPQTIIASEEWGTPDLGQRLQALESVQKRGYRIGIHLDPLLLFPNWRQLYTGLINQLARVVQVDRVAWWSLGALRFPLSLKDNIRSSPPSRLFWGELVFGFDGKYRYFKPLRFELFRFIRDRIYSRISSEIPIYLCMEDEEMWQEIFPGFPIAGQAVNSFLYRRVRE